MPDKCELWGWGAPYNKQRGLPIPEKKRTPCHPVPQPLASSPALTSAMSEQIALEKTDRSQEPRFKAFFIAQQQMKLFTYT